MSATDTALYRLKLFGPPALTNEAGAVVPGVGSGKPLAILSYLALRGAATRTDLVTLLWGELDESNARNAFRQTLHRLRTALGEVLPKSADELRLPPDAPLWCDVAEYERLAGMGAVEAAAALYSGDFLDGFDVGEASFSHWADGERARLRSRQYAVLEQCVAAALERADAGAAAEYGARLVELAPFDSTAAVLHATVLGGAGRRVDAVHALRRHIRLLRQELDAAPAAEVTELLARLESAPGLRPEGRAATPEAPSGSGFVGREAELTLLLAEWRHVQAGAGCTVVVTGPAGIGKTRLIHEFTQRATVLGPMLLLRSVEAEGGGAVPYGEVASALRPLLRAPGLAGASAHLLAEAARLLPELRDRFDLPAAGPVDDEAARLRFFEGVTAMVEAVAYETPLCLVVDHADHAAASTLRLLAYMAARLRGSAVLLVFGWPTEAGRCPLMVKPAPGSARAAAEVALDELDEHAALALARSELKRAGGDVEDAALVVRLAGGHPLRVEEAARRVARGETVVTVPATLPDILRGRIAALNAAERRALNAIALIDHRTPLALVAAAAHLPLGAAVEAIERLAAEGLVVHDGAVSLAHRVVAVLVLDELTPEAQLLFAQWAADAALAQDALPAAVLADLLTAAGRPEQAFGHAHAAALAAAAVGAFAEAAERLRLARELAPDDARRREIDTLLEALGHRRILQLTGTASYDVAAERSGASAAAPGDVDAPGAVRARRHATSRRRMTKAWQVRGWLAGLAGLVATAAILALVLADRRAAPARVSILQDTLLLGSAVGARAEEIFMVTGELASPRREQWRGGNAGPEWLEDLSLPWMNAEPSPDGQFVALERASAGGTQLYVISADRQDTVRVPQESGDLLGLGWSPDGAWVLALHTEPAVNGAPYRSNLVAFAPASGAAMRIDSTTGSNVTHAAWSPAGQAIAWIARDPNGRHTLFASDADGGDERRLLSDISAAATLAWSPDGSHIAVLRHADGGQQIFAVNSVSGEARRVTFDAVFPRNPQFSPDGRFLAYEAGAPQQTGVYLVAALGGEPRVVAGPGEGLTLLMWRGESAGYLDRLRARVPPIDSIGGRRVLQLSAMDQRGDSIGIDDLSVTSIADSIVGVMRPGGGESSAGVWQAVGRRTGVGRIVVSANGWRTDTVFVRVGRGALPLIDSRFTSARPPPGWSELGPAAGRPAVGAGWPVGGTVEHDHGLLSDRVITLEYGIVAEAVISGAQRSDGARDGRLMFAIVPAAAEDPLDPRRPQFQPIAAVTWLAEAGRLAYSVGREVWTEPLDGMAGAEELRLRIHVSDDGRVAFAVNGQVRWEPATRIATGARARVWVGGRSAGEVLRVSGVRVEIPGY